MKANFRLCVFISFFSFYLFIPALSAVQELPLDNSRISISMDFKDASLKDVLKIFSIQSGLNFIASEMVADRTLTLYFDKVPLQEAMDKLFKANNLSYELDPEANIFIVKDWGKVNKVETITRVFYLRNATVSTSSLKEEMANTIGSGGTTTVSTSGATSGGTTSGGGKWKTEEDSGITQAVKKLLSEYGSVIEDFRTNSLIVSDTPARMAVITQVIAALDIKVPQVMLEVEILDVSKNAVDKIGFNWSGVSGTGFNMTTATIGTKFPFLDTVMPKLAPSRGTVTIDSMNLVVDFLRTLVDTKYLARPRLLTLNNETAEIKIVTNESIGVLTSDVATTGSVNASPERSETGVILRVTPQINTDTGEITMFICPQVSEATAGNVLTSNDAEFQFRDPEIRSTKTTVRIQDGETVIIGGLIRDEFIQTQYRVPILSDIPFIGALFRQKGGGSSSSDKNKQRELLVFITPHIVKDKGMELAKIMPTPKPPAKLPQREQENAALAGRQAVIRESMNSFENR